MSISSLDAAGAEAAKHKVEALSEEVKVGKVYEGKVTSIKDFGAFIEILPGRDGLCHISELDDKYVGKVEDVCKVGDKLQVKVIAIDDQDRVKLSRKALLREEKGLPPGEPSAPPPRGASAARAARRAAGDERRPAAAPPRGARGRPRRQGPPSAAPPEMQRARRVMPRLAARSHGTYADL